MKQHTPMRKAQLCFALNAFALLNASAAQAQITAYEESNMNIANHISIQARAGQDSKLASFLTAGAQRVAATEPDTLHWYALQAPQGQFAIVDFFPHAAGRDAHFAGEVAAALQANAAQLVERGWHDGVLAHLTDAMVLSSKAPVAGAAVATQATYIVLQARSGQAQALEDLLTGAAAVIEHSEPDTLLWTAWKINDQTFAIFDTFTDASGREAHFAGQVAAALQQRAEALIVGGWAEGVVPNIRNYTVIAEAGR